MPFRLLFLDNADVVSETASRDEALVLLAGALDRQPELEGEIAVQEIDRDGLPIGDPVMEPWASARRPPALF